MPLPMPEPRSIVSTPISEIFCCLTIPTKRLPLKDLLDNMVRNKSANAGYDTTALTNYLLTTKPQDIDKME